MAKRGAPPDFDWDAPDELPAAVAPPLAKRMRSGGSGEVDAQPVGAPANLDWDAPDELPEEVEPPLAKLMRAIINGTYKCVS